jgi:hypothetical protein
MNKDTKENKRSEINKRNNKRDGKNDYNISTKELFWVLPVIMTLRWIKHIKAVRM